MQCLRGRRVLVAKYGGAVTPSISQAGHSPPDGPHPEFRIADGTFGSVGGGSSNPLDEREDEVFETGHSAHSAFSYVRNAAHHRNLAKSKVAVSVAQRGVTISTAIVSEATLFASNSSVTSAPSKRDGLSSLAAEYMGSFFTERASTRLPCCFTMNAKFFQKFCGSNAVLSHGAVAEPDGAG